VSLITGLPGDRVHAEFGHSAIRVRDPALGLDRAYNYGTFDFSDPYFVPKFAYGHLRYFLSTASYPAMRRAYRQAGRPLIEQRLNLTLEQRNALFRVLEINARPANRAYRYDFFFDNCSTRVRDALEKALGDALAFAPRPAPETSFRRLLDPYVADRPLLDVGFDLALGTPADRVATAREAVFLPEYLMRSFDHATVRAGETTRPLVAERDTVFWVSGYTATERSLPWPGAVLWGAFVAAAAATAWQARRIRQGGGGEAGEGDGRLAAVLDATLLGLTGTAGLVVVFLWFVSEHAVTGPNWNLLWAWPTHLVAAFWMGRPAPSASFRVYLGTAAAAALVLALGWNAWPQDFHWAVRPVVLLLGLRLAWRAARPALGRRWASTGA
jgi:hypothetical protein